MNAANYTWFRLKDAIVTAACGILCTCSLAACDTYTENAHIASAADSPTASSEETPPPPEDPESYSLNSVLDSLSTTLRGASTNVAPQAEAIQARTKEEWNKLFRWEYRVLDLPGEIGAQELEGRLSELGGDGWEVFSIMTRTDTVRVSCKRRPQSALAYLKYVPGL